MNIDQTVKPLSPLFLRSQLTQENQYKETFHEVFQRALIKNSSSRPPKVELRGVLVPLPRLTDQPGIRFKLETNQNEYPLRMTGATLAMANKLEWEEVVVKGYLDPDEFTFAMEKISLVNRDEPYRLPLGPNDLYLELDCFRKSVSQRGVVEVEPDFLAS
jgi:hypothetical protein